MAETAQVRVPRKLLWGSFLVWLALLPLSAWLAGSETLGRRIEASIVNGFVGAAFGVLIGSVVIGRLQAAADRAAAQEAKRRWEKRVRYIVRALIEDAGDEMQSLAAAAYAIVTPALPEGEWIVSARFLRRSARVPVPIEAQLPLQDATAAAERVKYELMRASDSERQASVRPDTLDGVAEEARRSWRDVNDRAERLAAFVNDLAPYVDDVAPEITRCAFEIRSAARRLTAPDDEADDSTIGVARRALQGGREAYGVLLGVRELVAKLSDVYADAVEGTRDKSARFERGADAVRDLGTTYSDAAYRLEKEQHALRQRLPRP